MLSLLNQDPDTWDHAIDRHAKRLDALGTVEAYCEALDAVGWTEGWSEERRAALRARIAQAWDRTPRRVYVYPAVGAVSFETDGFSAEGEYGELLHELAAVTHGAFAPADVVQKTEHEDDEERPTEVELSFRLGDETFQVSFDQDDDWCKNDALELVDRALDKAGTEERFVALPTAHQVMTAAFVRPAAFQKALDDGLIPDAAVVI